MSARIDLHTHSHCSDGTLAPAALVALAASRQVAVLALTDHDTLQGCEDARTACAQQGIVCVNGVELTCLWRDMEVHVVGLGIDPTQAALRAHCGRVLDLRRERILGITQRLTKAGLPGELLAQLTLAAAVPTRTHLARALCSQGLADSLQSAFDRWLGRGRRGYVAAHWPPLADVVACITGAGGTAVLAHAHRYRLSNGKLRELAAQFRAAGGRGLEVSLAGLSPGDAERLAALARRYELSGSIGSDFHEPGMPWRPLGRFAKLADRITPVTAHLTL